MEKIVHLHIEKLPEGVYLATSDEVQGLVAQGRTIQETLEIARDVAKKLIEARQERNETSPLSPAGDALDYPLIVNA
ncbi:MAG: type II toxin-antitoxin system HicB family antitoxin [Gammaproteobacteria bacterium]